jgi:hypothetical protein
MFIPEPNLDFVSILDPRVKKAPDPGSATLHNTANRSKGVALFLPVPDSEELDFSSSTSIVL